MTSMLCVRQPGGQCSVQNSQMVEELVIDSEDRIKARRWRLQDLKYVPRSEARSRRPGCKRPQSVPVQDDNAASVLSSASSRRGIDSTVLAGHSLKLQQWLNEKQVKALQDKADTEARKTRKMYESVLETEDTFVKDIEAFLANKEMLSQRKKELLHKKWNEHVGEPIQNEIGLEIDGPRYPELLKRKRQLYKEYLEHTNKKGHVFLDVIAPDEYYAMSLHPTRPSLLVAETRKLRDPLLSQERNRAAEDRVLFRCVTGSTLSDNDIAQVRLPPLPLVPLGRHGTECHTWLEMPLGDIESPVRNASRRRMTGDFNYTHFDLSDWPSVVDQELSIQKRRHYHHTPSPPSSAVPVPVTAQ